LLAPEDLVNKKRDEKKCLNTYVERISEDDFDKKSLSARSLCIEVMIVYGYLFA
jgi:hypothetical protein